MRMHRGTDVMHQYVGPYQGFVRIRSLVGRTLDNVAREPEPIDRLKRRVVDVAKAVRGRAAGRCSRGPRRSGTISAAGL